jgi:hypothetical protein
MRIENNHKELRAAWVAALRSGEYKQGVNNLRTPDGEYCCLGVAGKIIGLSDDLLGDWTEDEYPYDTIQQAFGLSDCLGAYAEGQLYSHNDHDGLTFSQIADIIDAEPEGLFID